MVSSRATATSPSSLRVPKHDLPPVNGGPERALGRVVRRLDTRLVHEGEEMRQVQEQRACEIP